MERLRQAPTLTAREKDIMRLLFGGYSNREMGESLGLSALTIRNHVSKLLFKFQVRNRTEGSPDLLPSAAATTDD